MKTRHLTSFLLTLFAAGLAGGADDLKAKLQLGLFEEEANHNLPAAIAAYQATASQFEKDRELAATAIFRLGECYRKLDRTNEAAVCYLRIVREFAESPTLLKLSRQNLVALGLGEGTTAASDYAAAGYSAEVKTKLKALLREQVKLAEAGVADQQKRVQVGLAPQLELVRSRMELLARKRELLALDAPLSAAALVEWNQMLQEEIHFAEADLQAAKIRLGAGTLDPTEVARCENVLLTLKRQLVQGEASLTAGPATQPTGPLGATPEEETELRRLQALVQDSPDLINARGAATAGNTPLQTAAARGQVAVVQFLLDHQADLEIRNYAGQTALLLAADAGHKSAVELLLAKGADINATNSNTGETALHLAVSRGYKAVVETLLAHKANANAPMKTGVTPLHTAISKGLVPMVELLLAHGADVNAQSEIKDVGNPASSGTEARLDAAVGTPLHAAASTGQTNVVTLLLAKQAKVDARNQWGYTPLLYAAARGNVAAAALLLQAGADVNAVGNEDVTAGWTPLLLAAYGGHKELAALLLKHKANPNVRARTDPGWTPLIAAGVRNDPELAALLLANRADPNLAGTAGDTPLLQAMGWRSRPWVELLLTNGVNPNQKGTGSRQDWSALMHSVNARDQALTELLLAHGANASVTNRDGATPLHRVVAMSLEISARPGGTVGLPPPPAGVPVRPVRPDVAPAPPSLVDLAKLLLAHKADVNRRDSRGRTPLNLLGVPANPLDETEKQLADLLRQHGARDEGPEPPPNPRAIRIWRAGWLDGDVVFQQDTNGLNRFTLIEAIVAYYRYYNGMPHTYESVQNMQNNLPAVGRLAFPDLSKVQIWRPTAGKSGQKIAVNLMASPVDVDCSQDLELRFGDVVEIPEREHALGANLVGLPAGQRDQLLKCVPWKVILSVKGATSFLKDAPPGDGRYLSRALASEAMGALRTSSDLSRVKVTRRDPKTGETKTFNVDVLAFRRSGRPVHEDLALKDGDSITVPDKE
jgi:ankyrin repeat protein